MKQRRIRVMVGILFCFLCVRSSGQAQDMVIVGGTLIDGTGRNPLPNAVIVIEGSRKVADTALDPKFLNPLPRPTFADDPLGYRGPEISSIAPKIAREGDSSVTLEVSGKRFNRQSVVRLDNAELPTQFSSDAKLRATISSAGLRKAGTYAVTVVTPGSGGAPSNVMYFVVNFK